VGVQEEDECHRSSLEVQILTGSTSLFQSRGSRLQWYFFPCCKSRFHCSTNLYGYNIWSRHKTDGCEDNVPTWEPQRRNLHELYLRICSKGKERVGVQTQNIPLWYK